MVEITEFHYAGQITNPRCLINKGDNNLRFDDESMIGIIRKAGEDTISIQMESTVKCCEDFGFLINDVEDDKDALERLATSKVTRVYLNIYRERYLKDSEIYNFSQGGGTVCVNIETDSETFEITMYCCQNGYYSHEVRLEWPGYCENMWI